MRARSSLIGVGRQAVDWPMGLVGRLVRRPPAHPVGAIWLLVLVRPVLEEGR
jgi:hypothetical protein